MTINTPARRLPSVAFVITLITGAVFTWMGLRESAGGFLRWPIDITEAVGGLLEAVTFGVSFLVTAWFLWVRPRIGGYLLINLGLALGIWIAAGWAISSWLIPSLLVGLPVMLGVLTLRRENLLDSFRSEKNN